MNRSALIILLAAGGSCLALVPVAMGLTSSESIERRGDPMTHAPELTDTPPSMKPTIEELAPLPTSGEQRMDEGTYSELGNVLQSAGAPLTLHDRLSSSRVLSTADGRTIDLVPATNGSACMVASRNGALVAAGCSGRMRAAGIEPIVDVQPPLGSTKGRIQIFGLTAATVSQIEVIDPDGTRHGVQSSNWAFWWSDEWIGPAPVAIEVTRRDGSQSLIEL